MTAPATPDSRRRLLALLTASADTPTTGDVLAVCHRLRVNGALAPVRPALAEFLADLRDYGCPARALDLLYDRTTEEKS